MVKNTISISNQKVDISVSVYMFKDGNSYIAYCPSLDLTGYDLTEDDARKEFEFVLQDWLKEQLSNGTLDKDLEAHGWNMEQNKGDEPALTDMLKHKSSQLVKVLAMPEYRRTNISAEVAYC